MLVKDADIIYTLDKQRRVLKNSSVLIEGNTIKKIGKVFNKTSDNGLRIIDAKGFVVLPGLVNTHHHLFQGLLRGVEALKFPKKVGVISWVETLCKLMDGFDAEAAYIGAKIGLAELLLSGCTTTVDFPYLFSYNRNDIFDATVKAAKDMGMRFFSVRGYIENYTNNIWPKQFSQKPDVIVNELSRVIKKFHDPKIFSMIRIGVGPCAQYTTSKELFEKVITLARRHKVRIHTHCAEDLSENEYSRKVWGMHPINFLNSIGALGKDVWLAHCIYVDDSHIELLAKTKTGVAHCAVCNMSKKQPAPVTQMIEKGVNVGIGVDGSASNDSSHMIFETRIALHLQGMNPRLPQASYLSPTQALELSTLGGARVLGMDKEIGSIEVGKAADIILYDVSNNIECAGSNSPLEAIFRTLPRNVEYSIVNGNILVEKGELIDQDVGEIIHEQRRVSKRLDRAAIEKHNVSFKPSMQWVRAFK